MTFFFENQNIHLFGCKVSVAEVESGLASCAIFHWGVDSSGGLQGQQLQSMGSRARGL